MNRSHARVEIPVDEILAEYAAWVDELVEALAGATLAETRREARGAFQNKTRKLYRSIRKRKSRYDKHARIVGAFAPYAHLVESGHRVTLGKDGRVVGHASPHRYLEPALEKVQAMLPQIIESVVEPTVTVTK